ncbi:hypothetical protein CDL12_02813 [Handroanthus impetiginosus]|uniref:S-protein homolog n=1 Tax=Handroanthus impetiginosus TaxID=429701 RepID=A0A2G9I3Y0_9LAMI|nr:hypothetical protein CDL12_02813 [Handroanthus impetiginosus]
MASTTFSCKIPIEYEVHVVNKLPSPRLELHYASGDDELGCHNIIQNYDFNLRFCEDYTGTILFFCHLWCTNKEIAFDVFKSRWPERCLCGKCY